MASVPHIPMLPIEKRRFTVLDRKGADRLLAELPPHLRSMAAFALATGLRDANIRGLQWNSVDLARRVAWVWPDEAEAGRAIGVPLNEDALRILRAELGRHPTHVFTFAVADKHGKELRREPIGKRSNNTAWRKARVRAGFPTLRWHDLRHACPVASRNFVTGCLTNDVTRGFFRMRGYQLANDSTGNCDRRCRG